MFIIPLHVNMDKCKYSRCAWWDRSISLEQNIVVHPEASMISVYKHTNTNTGGGGGGGEALQKYWREVNEIWQWLDSPTSSAQAHLACGSYAHTAPHSSTTSTKSKDLINKYRDYACMIKILHSACWKIYDSSTIITIHVH